MNETLYNQPTNRLTGRDAIAAAMARHDPKTKAPQNLRCEISHRTCRQKRL